MSSSVASAPCCVKARLGRFSRIRSRLRCASARGLRAAEGGEASCFFGIHQFRRKDLCNRRPTSTYLINGDRLHFTVETRGSLLATALLAQSGRQTATGESMRVFVTGATGFIGTEAGEGADREQGIRCAEWLAVTPASEQLTGSGSFGTPRRSRRPRTACGTWSDGDGRGGEPGVQP